MIMETNQVAPSNRSFWLGKLFSLAGLVPIGIYVIVHLYNNMRSLYGEESFNLHLAESRSYPLIVPITILVIWIPIVFHGIYGLFVMKKAKPNLIRFPFFENLKYVLQRLSGIGLLLFIPAHVYKTRIEPTLSESSLDFKHMVEGFHEPLTLFVYILGVLGVAYHLANGVWQFSIGWGIATTERGMKRVQVLSYVLFIALLVMGYGAMWGFLRVAP
jgi:succinate dehydrogenase / fumarate reductase cytochrome b subunit